MWQSKPASCSTISDLKSPTEGVWGPPDQQYLKREFSPMAQLAGRTPARPGQARSAWLRIESKRSEELCGRGLTGKPRSHALDSLIPSTSLPHSSPSPYTPHTHNTPCNLRSNHYGPSKPLPTALRRPSWPIGRRIPYPPAVRLPSTSGPLPLARSSAARGR